MIEIIPLTKEHIDDAIDLFTRSIRTLRESVPAMPGDMENPAAAAGRLDRLLSVRHGVAAVENGRFAGYLGWFLVDGFRGTQRKGAYVPEWGHGAREGRKAEIYRALYRAASREWAEAYCGVHAITLLGHDRPAIDAWFWNGFGLTVVDAVRPVQPLEEPPWTDLEVRKAIPADAPALAQLDAEHWRHYTQPPVFMAAHESQDVDAALESISDPRKSVWLATDEGNPAGFIRFAGGDHDGIDSIASPTTIGITGAYVRPGYRGRGAAPVMLDAALRNSAEQEYSCCGVNFESFNPEAAAFWPKYFTPVAYSLLRVPEVQRAAVGD